MDPTVKKLIEEAVSIIQQLSLQIHEVTAKPID